MKQDHLFKTIPCDKFNLLSKGEVVELYKDEESLRLKLQKEVDRLKGLLDLSGENYFFLNEQTVNLKNKIFGKSSEKDPKKNKGSNNGKKLSKKKVQLPSERYPNIPVIEEYIPIENIPDCPCCSEKMKDSGMTEDSEVITTIPAKKLIIRQKRRKYKCGKCHGALKTAPNPPRITPGSSYSDEMMIDVALSKYCDLIPIERYAEIAARQGMMGLPPQSLIELTHKLATFLEGAYDKCKEEVLSQKVIHADESPHNMLEGDERSNWYLWGFSTKHACYFEIQGTRSGDIASEMLAKSACEYLVSDVFSGYKKAVRIANKLREKLELPLVKSVYCNAHARRKFKDAKGSFPEEVKFFIKCYGKIYHLEGLDDNEDIAQEVKGKLPLEVRRIWQRIYFKIMERKSLELMNSYSKKSTLGKALRYFYKNFKELTLFLKIEGLPIDNNPQERLFRSPAVGRKTWYGTHSKKGARTAAVLFTLVQSCKMNKVNPREYFKDLVRDLHLGKEVYSPHEYLEALESSEVHLA